MALTRKRLIQVKKESTYGTDSTPAGTDALLVRNLEITPIEADVVSRDLIRPYFGNSPQLLANTRVSITFQVELAGSGTAGTAPRYGAVLQACGLSETIVAATSVTYAPVSSSLSSATIYFNNDGIRHILTGCRGTFVLNAEVGQIPTIDFTMIGVYNAPTDTALPSVTYSAQASPLIFKQGNTSSFQFFSYAGCLQSVSLDIAISNRPNGGIAAGRITELTGLEASGKSLVGASLIATTQKRGGVAVLIDTENAVNDEFFSGPFFNIVSVCFKPFNFF